MNALNALNALKKRLTGKRITAGALVLLLVIAAFVFGESRAELPSDQMAGEQIEMPTVAYTEPETPFLDTSSFAMAAQNERWQLLLHEATGHFQVVDRRNQQAYRSYPNPDHWDEGTTSETWQNHLKSPILFRVVQFETRRDQARLTSLIQEKGVVSDIVYLEDGFRVTFTVPDLGIAVPVRVALHDTYVETIIEDAGIRESSRNSLAGVRVYPFFGSQASVGQDGYLLVPDGPGALIRFEENRSTVNMLYSERVFGADLSYQDVASSNRESVRMPVYGLKNEDQGFLAVVHEGAEYAEIIGSPSGSLSQYNWAAADFIYRQSYFQTTNTDGTEGFTTFERARVQGYDRAIRYYFLAGEQANYVGMGQVYRDYLMQEKGLEPLESVATMMPLHLSFYGGDLEEGFLFDSYVRATTTAQAEEIVNQVRASGIENLTITYHAWQRGGDSSSGGGLKVDRRIGGTDGMKNFIAFAASLGYPVYLDAGNYAFNNRSFNSPDGFRRQRDGVRNLASNIISFDEGEGNLTLVSPRFMKTSVEKDLSYFRDLGAAGFYFDGGLSTLLVTDHNDRHFASRREVNVLLEEIYEGVAEALGSVTARNPNHNLLRHTDHIFRLADDYSYDAFIDESVPFLHIALHGLVTYSGEHLNQRNDYVVEFLRSIEYGAEPSIVLTHATSQELLRTRSLSNTYSTSYRNWSDELVEQYQRYNEALGPVRNQFITNHRTVARGVKETTYANNYRIVVNYNQQPVRIEAIEIGPQDFVVIQGGA